MMKKIVDKSFQFDIKYLLTMASIIVLVLICLGLLIGDKYYQNEANNSVFNNYQAVSKSIDNNKPFNENIKKTIQLSSLNEKYSIDDHVTLLFKGTEINGIKEYNLNIYINNKLINNNIFNTKTKYINNTFTVYHSGNYYFFVSSLTNDYILITDNDGNIINSYKDVKFKINDDSLKYTINDKEYFIK